MITRYVITKVNEAGLRVLAFSNQGRYHYDREPDAQGALQSVLRNTTPDTLKAIFGDASKMKVIPAECYDHGDCVATVFGFDPDSAVGRKALVHNGADDGREVTIQKHLGDGRMLCVDEKQKCEPCYSIDELLPI